MKKIFTLCSGLLLAVITGFGQASRQSVQDPMQEMQINTRIDNISYWKKLAANGLVPYNTEVPFVPAESSKSKNGTRAPFMMTSDIVIHDEAGVTQSENSVAVDPDDALRLINSNNSEQSGGSLLGADYFNTSDAGSTWTGSKTGAGGSNWGDPAAGFDLNGRRYIGHINSSGGQSVARSDNGTTWTPVILANNGAGAYDLLDKNHLAVDNTASAYSGYVYSAWTQFVSGSANNNDIMFCRSANSGVNWSVPINISNATAAGSHNQGVNIQVGPAGQVYSAWVIYDTWGPTNFYENAVGFAKSTNGGSTFSAATRIHNNIKGIRPSPYTPTSNSTGKSMRVNSFPSMAVDVSGGPRNGYIYIVWSNVGVPGTNTGTNVSVYCMRSTDGGTTWGTPVRVNQGTSANDYASFFPWITCDPATGKLYCIFYDDRDLGSTSTAVETWMAYSEDGGVNWADIQVSDVSFTPAPITGLAAGYFGDYLGITSNDNRVCPVWTDNRSGRALSYSSPIHFSNYCIATGGGDEYISGVNIGSINNTSASEGYQNFTHLSTNIPVNSSATITGTNGLFYSGDQWGFWVDWNNDGDFSDASETIYTGTSTSATVAPPYGTSLGPKTLRVRLTYTGGVTACGSTQYGEVEEYTLNVTTALPNYWTGTFNHYWHNGNNWSLGHIPTAVEDVYLTNAGYQPVYVDSYPGTPAEECKTLTVQAGGQLEVGDMTLSVFSDLNISGQLSMTDATGIINIGGNWNNYVGAAGFSEGPARVVFNGGAYHQYCTNETFNILEVNKVAGGAFRPYNGHNVVCAAYDWTAGAVDVYTGSFTANNLLDNGIAGAFYNNAGGTINLTNSSTGWVDLNGELHIYGGTVNVYGTISAWPYSHNASIEMNSGVLDFHNCGISIVSSAHTLATNITGGTIRTAYGFYSDRSDFTPAGGTLELYGTNDAGIYQSNGSTLFNLNINKSSAKGTGSEPVLPRTGDRVDRTRGNGVRANLSSLNSNLNVTNTLTITSGTLNIGAYTCSVVKDANVYGTLTMTDAAGVLNVGTYDGDFLWFFDGSTGNFSAGTINLPYAMIIDPTASFTATTSNTINFGTTLSFGGIANYSPTTIFGNINVNMSGGSWILDVYSTAPFNVAGNFSVAAGNTVKMWNNTLNIHGSLLDNATSQLYLYTSAKKEARSSLTDGALRGSGRATSGVLTVDPDFNLNGLLDVANGSVAVHGRFSMASTGAIHINGGSFVADAPNHPDKGWEYIDGNITMSSGLFEITYNSINLGSISTTAISGGTMRTGGAFSAGYAGTFQPTGGVVEVIGSQPDCNLYCGNGNYFHDLLINRSTVSPVVFQWYDVSVKNNFTILSGALTPNNYTFFVGGNWSNAVGTAGFEEGTGTVVFDGANAADILTTETFYNLSLNKTYAAFDALEVMQDVTVTNDLHLIDGSMKLRNPADLIVAGNLTIDLNAGLNASDSYGPLVVVGKNWSNANTSYAAEYGFYPGNYSTVTFNGAADQMLTTSCTQETFNNLIVYKSAGRFRSNDNLLATGNAEITNGMWEDNIPGLTHTIYGDLTVQPSGVLNTAANQNTFEFAGSRHSILTYSGATGYFHHLFINKDIGYSVTQVGNTSCQNAGNLTVDNGYYFLNGYMLIITGDIAVNSAAYLSLAPASTLVLLNTKSLNVNSGGRLEINGTAGSQATIRSNVPATARYALNVNSGGTIAADYCMFNNMGVNGVNIAAGSTVDLAHAFKGCTFQDGAAGGTLLTINNAQTLTIRNAIFPNNTWGGASNVSKTLNSGHVYFVDFTGGFSGETNDNDAFNLIDWVETLTATATATPGNICPGSPSQLNVTRTGGLTPFTYLWSPSAGLSNPAIINPVATPAGSTTYSVTVTDALGTTASGSIPVTVSPVLPVSVSIVVSANPSPPGNYVTFTATPVNGGSSPSYQWKKNGNPVGTGLPTYSDNTLAYNDQITCIMTSNYLCPSGNPATSNTITMIIVNTNTTVTGTIPSPLDLCFDASNTITVGGAAGSFLVQNGARAVMIAGSRIDYLYGSKVEPGGYLHGYITTTNSFCGSMSKSMVSSSESIENATQEGMTTSGRFLIYPNPTTGTFTLLNRGPEIGKVQVEIYNIRGERVLTSYFADKKSHSFSLSGQTAGLYFVKVLSGDQIESFKLILNR